ncbi:hypothetical protein FOB75_09400 [Vibrio parahaemolyticus]|uniref:hypothetical protein n=1 Tax=Vibrio parahaemolyticus TaxID=670 RepID=UPI0012387D56|nr:hypothetical protein [Vibrio parahaemolyticus]QET61109.1 hypothetical protein FOB75_09400 [Vibrio parahaemolyticus]
MSFEVSILEYIGEAKLEAAKELSRRDSRYKEILSLVVAYCEDVGFINNDDEKIKSKRLVWLSLVVDIHLTSILLTDKIDGNDIPMDSEMIKEDNESKARQIIENMIVHLIASIPKLAFKI